MLNILRARLQQGKRTMAFPAEKPTLPKRFRGLPEVTPTPCLDNCTECVVYCPTKAIKQVEKNVSVDLGKCIFCNACVELCPSQKINFSKDYRLSVGSRDALNIVADQPYQLAEKMRRETLRVFGRSINLRQISAGGCNACEADLNVLSTIGFDLSRFGIHFVASPRHADAIVVTGPVTKNMRFALDDTYKAVPEPKFVIVVGACAISGGLYADSDEALAGIGDDIPVDLYIPGCPPHPITILDGFLRWLGRLPAITV